jgi:hypothetical protein
MALVIKKWYASSTPNEQGAFVHLIGREAGLFSWFLSIIGLDPTTEIEIKDNIITFTSASLSGRTKRVIPMKSLTSAFYGYEKPLKESIILTIILLPFFFIGLIVGPLYYFLNKKLSIGVVEASGWSGGFGFKRSVIEGQNINEEEAYHVIEIVRWLIERKAA